MIQVSRSWNPYRKRVKVAPGDRPVPGLEVTAMMTKFTMKRTITAVVTTELLAQVRKDILEAAKAMVVTRERQEEEAGAEGGLQ